MLDRKNIEELLWIRSSKYYNYRILGLEGTLENTKIQIKDLFDTVHI